MAPRGRAPSLPATRRTAPGLNEEDLFHGLTGHEPMTPDIDRCHTRVRVPLSVRVMTGRAGQGPAAHHDNHALLLIKPRRFDAGDVTTKALVRVRRSGERSSLKGSGWRKAPEGRDGHRDHCINQLWRSSIAAQSNSRTRIVHPEMAGALVDISLGRGQRVSTKRAVIAEDHGP